MASTLSVTQKSNFAFFGKIIQKTSCKTFHRKTYFAQFREFVYNFLFKIAEAKVKQHYHYFIPTLFDNTPDTIIIPGGCNDVSNKNSNFKDIAKAVGRIENLCCNHGANQVLILSLICRKNIYFNYRP